MCRVASKNKAPLAEGRDAALVDLVGLKGEHFVFKRARAGEYGFVFLR